MILKKNILCVMSVMRVGVMIEIAHMLFVYTSIELKVIILGGLIMGIYFIYKEGKKIL